MLIFNELQKHIIGSRAEGTATKGGALTSQLQYRFACVLQRGSHGRAGLRGSARVSYCEVPRPAAAGLGMTA
jgi:hypothetical protein